MILAREDLRQSKLLIYVSKTENKDFDTLLNILAQDKFVLKINKNNSSEIYFDEIDISSGDLLCESKDVVNKKLIKNVAKRLARKPNAFLLSSLVLLSVSSVIGASAYSLRTFDESRIIARNLSTNNSLEIGVNSSTDYFSLSSNDVEVLNESKLSLVGGSKVYSDCTRETLLINTPKTTFPTMQESLVLPISCLPSFAKLVAGELPIDENDTLITEYQFKLFNEYGFTSYYNTIDSSSVSFNSILGSKFLARGDAGNCFTYKISGIVNTGMTSEEIDNIINTKKDDYLIQNKISNSFNNIRFVNNARYISLMNNSYSYKTSKESSHVVSSSRDFVYNHSNLYSFYRDYSALDNKVFFDKTKAILGDNEILLNLSNYLSSLKDSHIGETKKDITLYAKYNETDKDEIVTSSQVTFLEKLLTYAKKYYSAKNFVSDFNNAQFNSKYYVKEYFKSLQKDVPSQLLEEDKENVYSYYLKSIYENNNIYNDFDSNTFNKLNLLYKDMVSTYIEKFRNDIFVIYQYSIDEVNFNLAGFTLGQQDVLTKKSINKVCEESNYPYAFVIGENTHDEKQIYSLCNLVNKLVDQKEGTKLYLSNSNTAEINNVKEAYTYYSTIFIGLFVGLFVASMGLLMMFYYKNYRTNKTLLILDEQGINLKDKTKVLSIILSLVTLFELLGAIVLSVFIFLIFNYSNYGFILNSVWLIPDLVFAVIVIGIILLSNIFACALFTKIRE